MTKSNEPLNSAADLTKKNAGKYLTFTLGKEDYGIAIIKVKEIIGIMAITEIPDNPEYAKGVINLRDKVIPIIDLRLKFHMEPKEYDSRTCIIVVEISAAGRETQIGIIVDAVSEVLTISENEIEPPANFGAHISQIFILGLAKIEKKIKILLDIDHVLTSEEVASLE
jgi:purine-binding chemotaxis protein CheW